jgi:PAS domain S-box-containing protein
MHDDRDAEVSARAESGSAPVPAAEASASHLEELRRANAMLRTLIASSPLPIVVLDPGAGMVRLWNPAAEKLFGWKSSEVLGKSLPIVPRDKVEEFERFQERAAQGEALYDIETFRRTKAGTLVHISLSAAPLYEDGKVTGVMKIMSDVTARRKAEDALRNAGRAKDEFLATLAHELRNPLAPLRNAIEILRLQGMQAHESQWALDIMSRQMQQMTRLIDDLLDIARITGNKLELKKEVIDLSDVLRVAIETSKPIIESSGHEFSISLPQHPIYLKGDQVRIAQAISNLLNNAAKYTEPGGHIWLSAESRGHDAVIIVRDTGIGITAEMLPYVFDMFRQGERSSGTKGGLGIGLTLAKRLIKMHRGSIHVESKGLGKGSSFAVHLPIILQQEEETPRHPDRPVVGDAASMRILIVDDNEDAVSTLNMMLHLAGHHTRTARDGIEAVDLANTYRPNVVLLDIGMPRMNGYEAAETIRKQSWGQNMALIAMTGWGQESDRMRSREAGFDEHLVKPVDPQVLLRLLKKMEQKRIAAAT